MKSAAMTIYRWSWLVTLPITAIFLVWASTTIERFDRFNVQYDSQWFDISLSETGRVEAYTLWRLAELAIDPRVPALRRTGTKLRRIDLFVSESSIGELDAELPHSGFQYVSARILDGSKLRKIKLRYRGDFANHWWGGKKSLRVKTKKGSLFEGVRTFNLTIPKFDEQLNNHLGYRLATRMRLTAPKSEMVDVTLNGSWRGVHVFIEQPREILLRRHGLMPGDLYVGELVAKDRYTGLSTNVFDHPMLWEKAAVNNHFPEDSLAPLEALLALMRHGIPEEEVHHGLSELLDMEAWGRFAAYETLAQSLHFDQAHNWRLYFDPARSKFIPVVWDPTAWHPNWMPKDGDGARLDQIPSDLHVLLFRNGDFLRARDAAFLEFFQSGESDEFLAEMAETIERIAPSIWVDPFPHVSPRGFRGPGEKMEAMHRFATAVERVFADVRAGFLEDADGDRDGVRYAKGADPRALALSVGGRQSIRKIVLRFAAPLAHPPTTAHVRAWRDEESFDIDVTGALATSGNRLEIASQLLPRYELVDTGQRTVFRWRAEVHPAYYELVFGGGGSSLPEPLEVFVERGDGALEQATRVAKLVREPFDRQYAVVSPAPADKLRVWRGVVTLDAVQTVEDELLIEPGTTVRFGPGAGLILERRLIAVGRKDAPIRFVPAATGQDPWGAVVLRGPAASGSKLSHCEFVGGSGIKDPLREYSAMFSVHDVQNVEVSDCRFRDSKIVDDMVHAIYADIRFTDTSFVRALSDAVDLDHSEGAFTRCRFGGNGNDSIDLMTSKAIVLDTVFEGSGDKGISNGEGSRVLAINSRFDNNHIGVQSKDGSVAVLYNVELHNSEKALDAYKKNWQYGQGGSIFVYKSNVAESDEPIAADKRSRIAIYDSYVAASIELGERVDIDQNVDRVEVAEPRERRFARSAAEQRAFGDPFPSAWKHAQPDRRGAALP